MVLAGPLDRCDIRAGTTVYGLILPVTILELRNSKESCAILYTMTQVQTADIHAVWECYQVTPRCHIFDTPTLCAIEGVDTGHVNHPVLRKAYFILGDE